jgi:DNA-binding SARP family transcriptional activator/class 3 adenylate cyclase
VQLPRVSIGDTNRRFSLSLLGGVELTGPDGVVDLPNKKLAGLLAYLACTAPRPQSREKLAALLWGSHFDAQAKQNLRQALFRLRKLIGEDALESDGEVVSLNAAAVGCDVGRFEALVREGGCDALSAAADLYRGRLVDDVSISEEGWNEWLTLERERLLELVLGALMRLGELELAAGRAERALKAGQRAIALNDMREDAHRLIVQALAAAGRKAEALKHYRDLVALLRRELNTEPDAATRALANELRTTELSTSPAVRIATPVPQAEGPSPPVGDGKGDPGEANADAIAADGHAPVPRPASAERRQLTIMVCNIVGSVPLSARLDPEDLHELMAVFHKAIAEAVARFGGFVAQYLGDGAHVYFGYPAADEHDAAQAVRAGFAVLDAIGALKAPFDMALQASVGIATGLVVIGERPAVGDTRQSVAIGEAPNLAMQLQAQAAPGEILIAAGTRRLVGRIFDCRALGAGEAEGLPASSEAWQVRAENFGVTRFEARRGHASSALVGRQEEIDLLLRRWEQARLGEGRVHLLSGEPGIGKSRIAEALLEQLAGEPHARLRYFCSPHHAHSPLHPFIAQLEWAAGFEPGSDSPARLDRLEALLGPRLGNPPRDLALLADLLSLPADGRYPALDVSPKQKREMTLTALLGLLDGMAAQGPVLAVFEDAHWADPTSLDLLDRSVARVAGLPVLLVVTFRPELQPGWIGQPHVTMQPLSRLGRRDSADMVAGIAGGKALPDAVVEQVVAHTDGVPLFIEELTSSLLESGMLREEADRYVLDRPLPRLAIPTTLQASLVARLDRLGAVKDLAQLGAAIGREFGHELLAAVSSLAAGDLDAALGRLAASGLVSRRGTPPEASYVFKHALVQDAAYGTLLKGQRQQLHARIATALVGRFPAMAESQSEVIAHHFTEAGIAGEAIGYWRRAGRIAAARSAGLEAATFFERALHLLETLPESQSTLEQGCDIRLELRPVLLELGRSSQMLESLHEADVLAGRLGDDRRRGLICGFMTIAHSFRAELDEALAAGSRALEIGGRLDDLKTRIVATSLLVQVHYARGDYDRSAELAAGNLAVLPAEWVHETFGLGGPPSIWDRGCGMQALAELGRFSEAAGYEAEMMRLAASSERALTTSMALYSASALYVARGDWAEALTRIERWLAVARTGNFVFYLAWGIAFSVWPLAQLGQAAEAERRLGESERLLERLAANGVRANLAWFYCLMGRAWLRLGRPGEAGRLGSRALELCAPQSGFAAHAFHLFGEVAIHDGQFDAGRGEVYYRRALAVAEQRGMRPLVAHCNFGLGRLYRRTGKADQARHHLAAATTTYRETGMTYWLAQAEAEMRE